MIYIYDIIINWSKDKLYDFFEWEKIDKLTHIKKIPMFKVEKGIINSFFYNEVKLESSFISKIYNVSEVYSSKKVEKIPYACLLSDGITVLAINTDKLGNVKFRSKLMVDEEEEILCISQKLNKVDLKIKIGKLIDKTDFLTRNERKIKKFLEKNIRDAYKLKLNEKLKYLYTEYFGTHLDDNKKMHDDLIKSLIEVDNNHKNLYNLLQLISNKN